tara:strand:+ start:100 stop:510 length:411 start_codon:yes stop_codon:yes gene_type:complete
MRTEDIYNNLKENDGFTLITKRDIFVSNDNYQTYGRYSVANTKGDYFAQTFTNDKELKEALTNGLNSIKEYFGQIEEEHPLLCPLFPTFGGWIRNNNELVIDPVSLYRELRHALTMGNLYNQDAIFDFKIMDEIPL